MNERAAAFGCGQVFALVVFLLWLAVLPLATIIGFRGAPLGTPEGWQLLGVTGLALAGPFLLLSLFLRRQPAPLTAALAVALLAMSGYLLLDMALRSLLLSASLTAALRLAGLSLYLLAAAWWAPRLAGRGRPPIAAVLGLDRLRVAPLALAAAAAALLTLPWPLTGALGDRLAALALLLQAVARVLPDVLLAWGLVFFLLNAATRRTWPAGILTMLSYLSLFAATQFMAPSVESLVREVAVLPPLLLLLTELRARRGGVYPPLLLALAAYSLPLLMIDPRDAVVQYGIPELVHLSSYALFAAAALFLGVLLWAGRRIVQGLERRRGAALLPARANAALALALALALLAAWAGLYVAAGAPGFYDDGFLVILAEQADLGAAPAIADREERLAYVYHTLVATAERTQAPLRAELDALGLPYRPYYIVNMIRVDGHHWMMGRFQDHPGVAQVILNPNVRHYPHRVPFPLTELPIEHGPVLTNLEAIGAPEAWSLGVTGEGIVVAGQDSGYDWAHPALRPRYRGWDGRQADHNYHWHDAWDNMAVPFDDDSHGTHTMGTMVGDDGAGMRTGVAFGARWIGCRNMRRGVGNPASYAECSEFFLAPYPHGGDPFRDGDVRLAPHVVNNSWGCPEWEGCLPDTLEPALEALRAAGIMMVVSAGNEGPACSTILMPPANSAAVFSVGATNLAGDGIAAFSSRGPVDGLVKPDISAPGERIRSSVTGGLYGDGDGTSMAGPHVAGVVALVWSANPALIGQIDETAALLCRTARPMPLERACTAADAVPAGPLAMLIYNPICACGDVAGVPNNVYGCGVVDAGAAVRAARR